MNKATTLLATCALSLALVGCGGSEANTPAPETGSSNADIDIEAIEQLEGGDAPAEAPLEAFTPAFDYTAELTSLPVAIASIDPGWQPEDNGDAGTSDIWYVNGIEGDEGIYFTHASNEAGLSVTFVDNGKEYVDGVFYLDNQDDHLVTQADAQEAKVDIVFVDDFTCYDYATGTWYCRGNQAYYDSLVAGRTIMAEFDDGKTDVYELAADGSFTHEDSKYGSETGTWRMSAVNVIEFTFDSDGYVQQVRFAQDDEGNITFLDSYSDYELI